MNTQLMAIIIGAVVLLIIIIVFLMKRKKGEPEKLETKKEDKKALPSEKSEEEPEKSDVEEGGVAEKEPPPEDQADSQEAVVSDEAAEGISEEEAAPDEAVKKAALVSLPPGFVDTEGEAEQLAQKKYKDAKKERKLKKLRQGLAPTRGNFIGKITNLFKAKKEIDPALLEELEEALITADVGATTTDYFTNLLKEALEKDELADPDAVWSLLKQEVKQILDIDAEPWDFSKDKPYTIMVVGVNGVGKTTTIGKLASRYQEEGHKVVLAAADTFRAAAVNQLEIWGRRTKSEVVKSKEGADPSSVVFDAIKKAKEIDADIVIADTAGRLHTQTTLMEELKKVARVMGKAHEGAPNEVLLVLDATTGQNALHQVSEFGDALDLTGIALTKLDGTAKGGVIIGIGHEHKIPVRFIGIGEAKDDLREFEVDDFVDALFLNESDES